MLARDEDLLAVDLRTAPRARPGSARRRRPRLRARRRPRAARRTRRRRSGPRCRSGGRVASSRSATSLQHRVAGGVAEAVVDRLEVVEVDEHHADRCPLAAGAGQRVLDAVGEQRAVGEAGERVVERLVGELVLERLALADVAAVEHDAADVASSSRLVCRISNWRQAPSRCAACTPRTPVPAPPPSTARSPATARVGRGLDEVGNRVPHDVVGAVAEHALDRRALVGDRRRSASTTVIRSLECATSERKRASLGGGAGPRPARRPRAPATPARRAPGWPERSRVRRVASAATRQPRPPSRDVSGTTSTPVVGQSAPNSTVRDGVERRPAGRRLGGEC